MINDRKVITIIGLIPQNENLLSETQAISSFMEFCSYLNDISYPECQKIEREGNSIDKQKLAALFMWRDKAERTWKDLIAVLAKMEKCKTAKELARKYTVSFNEQEDVDLFDKCPHINDSDSL